MNSRLIRLEGFNNNISITLLVCSTWPSGKALALYVESPEFDSGHNLFLFASFLFFSSFFPFSFRLVFIFSITVLLCFYIQFLDLEIFFSALLPVPPDILREVLRFTYFQLKYTLAGTLSKPCRAFRGEPQDKFYTSMI